MTVSLASLILRMTKDQIYSAALSIASSVGLPVSSWQPGDPTRSLYLLEAEVLDPLEDLVVKFVMSGFLDYATGDWLTVLAKQVYNVDVPTATYAETSVLLTNTGAGVYDIDPGDLTFKSSLSEKTFHNITGGHLAAGGTLPLAVTADEAGAASSAGAGEIDTLVTTLLNVTCTNATAAVGLDAQDAATTRQQCRDKLGSLSPNGPKDAYSYVARNSDLTGIKTITRTRVYPDSTTGNVLVYVAGPSGAVAGPDVTAVTNAVVKWSTPLCITPTVVSANAVVVPVTYTLWVYNSVNKTASEIRADVLAALQALFAKRPIGGDIIPPATTGALAFSLVQSTVRGVYKDPVTGDEGPVFAASVSSPLGDTALANGDVASLGLVTGTINFVADP